METVETGFEGLTLIRPKVYGDDRGWFMETFKTSSYAPFIHNWDFCQDNLSCSSRGVLRGLHFQEPPHAQAKLVMVIQGKVLDIVLDIRTSSPTYGQHYSVILDGQKKEQLYIPKGFAHGFVALEDHTHFLYKCDEVYHPESERTILWNDPDLNIDWQISSPIISEKDTEGIRWEAFNSPF